MEDKSKVSIISKSKNENYAKKPLSAYMQWSLAERKKLKEEGFEGTDIMTLLGLRWSKITEEEKLKWQEIYNKDLEKYEREIKQYGLGQPIYYESGISESEQKAQIKIGLGKKSGKESNNGQMSADEKEKRKKGHIKQTISTFKFLKLNFNLKKIIFSFLPLCAQKVIYFTNKNLRRLIPESTLFGFSLKKFKKYGSYKLPEKAYGLIQRSDSLISCFTKMKIRLINFTDIRGDKSYLKDSFPVQTPYTFTFPIEQENGNIIYGNGYLNLNLYDRDYNIIKIFDQTNRRRSQWQQDPVYSICSISSTSFAIGLKNGFVKIYKLNDKTQNYDEKELKVHACIIRCLLYIPKFDYLVTGSSDKTIKVISLANQQQHKTLEGHSYVISSLLLLSNDRFASGGFTEIKIWSIKENTNIDCIKHINANEIFSHCFISLHSLRNEFFVCRASNEFSIWDANNYELIKIYKEESYIETLIVTRSHDIITSTKNMNINIWKIST